MLAPFLDEELAFGGDELTWRAGPLQRAPRTTSRTASTLAVRYRFRSRATKTYSPLSSVSGSCSKPP